jgi:HK97 gp10 family phage protein
MASFKVDGLAELEGFFENMAAMPNDVINKMLHAEADIAVKAQKRTAKSMLKGPYAHNPVKLAESIVKGKIKNTKDGKSLHIVFKGSRKRGNIVTPNAEIAFLNEFGKRGQNPRPFIKTANEECAEEALDSAGKVFDEFLNSL